MKHSTDRILVTHAGSLPRPDKLIAAWSAATSDVDAMLAASVTDIVNAQVKAGVDIPNDGELGKPMRSKSDLAAWGTYIFGRLGGFGPTPAGSAAPNRAVAGETMRIVGERWEKRKFPAFYTA